MYDVLILGAGPAGLTAGIYVARGGLKVAILDKMSFGGQLALTSEIENYPGFEKISGFELAYKMQQHAEKLGVEFLYEEVTSVDLKNKVVKTSQNEYSSKAIIIALGASPRLLGNPREQELTGSGISYCATCDGNFFRNKNIAVIGGGNTAIEDAMYLANLCNKVYLVHRREGFRATKFELDKLNSKENIELVLNSVVEEILGKFMVEGVVVKDKQNNLRTLDVNGIFVAIGRNPNTSLFEELELDNGYIVTDSECRTNIKGIYACGDIVKKSLRQVVTACSDGAIAGETAVKEVEI